MIDYNIHCIYLWSGEVEANRPIGGHDLLKEENMVDLKPVDKSSNEQRVHQ